MAHKQKAKTLFHGVTDFFSEMNRMSDTVHGRTSETQQRTGASAWAPITDIKAQGTDLIICCEVPGINLEDITIGLINGVLSITGEREKSDDHYYVQERFFGTFRRTVRLPEGVADDDIHAALRKGLLVVTVTGAAATAEPKKIQIAAEDE